MADVALEAFTFLGKDCKGGISAELRTRLIDVQDHLRDEIYKHLEKVSDRFDDVANEINSIVIEQV